MHKKGISGNVKDLATEEHCAVLALKTFIYKI
jgi:hypothetical protein